MLTDSQDTISNNTHDDAVEKEKEALKTNATNNKNGNGITTPAEKGLNANNGEVANPIGDPITTNKEEEEESHQGTDNNDGNSDNEQDHQHNMNIGNDKKEFNNRKASLRKEPKPVNIYSPTNTNLVKRKPKPPNGKLSDKWEKHVRRNVIDETTLKPTLFVDDNNISNMTSTDAAFSEEEGKLIEFNNHYKLNKMALNINLSQKEKTNMCEPLTIHGKDNMEKYFEKNDILASDNATAQCCDGIIGILFQKNKWIIKIKKKMEQAWR